MKNLKRDVAHYSLKAAGGLHQKQLVLDKISSYMLEDHIESDVALSEFVDVNPISTNSYQSDVLMPVVQGQAPVINYINAILAHELKKRRYRPIVLLCHRDLPACHFRNEYDGRHDSICDICKNNGRRIFEAFGIDTIDIANYYKSSSSQTDITSYYKQIDLNRFAKASLRAILNVYNINMNDSKVRELQDRLIRSGARLVDVTEEVLDDFNVSGIVGNHPVYLYCGVLMETASKAGYNVTTFGTGYRDKTLVFGKYSNRVPLHQFTNKNTVKNHIETRLSQQEITEIEDVMKSRADGSGTRYDYTTVDSGNEIMSNNSYTIVIFTNLPWDASLETSAGPFTDPFRWVDATIDKLIPLREAQELIIKTHPAEELIGTNESFYNYLTKKPNLKAADNTITLEPGTSIDFYDMINDIDVGIVFNSTTGLELAYNGIPAIVAGDTHYKNISITFDPNTQEEYFELLERIPNLTCSSKMQEMAKRYCHFLFVKKHLPFPFYSTDKGVTMWQKVTEECLEENRETFDRIVAGIVKGKQILRSPYDP